MSGPTKLYDLKVQVLAAVVNYFAAQDVELPSVQYVATGATPAGGGEELAVTGTIEPGTPGRTGAGILESHGIFYNSAAITVWLLRALAVPSAEGFALTRQVLNPASYEPTNAQTVDTDLYLVRKALVIAHAAGDIGVDSTTPMFLGPGRPLQPDGALGGSTTAITVELV